MANLWIMQFFPLLFQKNTKKNYVAEHHPTMGGNKNIGLTIVGDFCEFIAYVGWKEIVEMGLENSVEFTSESEGYSEHKEHIINGSSCQGYLFRCLNCKKYILYVDCD